MHFYRRHKESDAGHRIRQTLSQDVDVFGVELQEKVARYWEIRARSWILGDLWSVDIAREGTNS